MKTILVDAINGYVLEDGTINREMHEMLERFPNKKVVLTGANDEQFIKFHLDEVTYPVFTQKHNPEKTEPEYWKRLFEKYHLSAKEVIYFEHNQQAVDVARKLGITTYFYNHNVADIPALKRFIESKIA